MPNRVHRFFIRHRRWGLFFSSLMLVLLVGPLSLPGDWGLTAAQAQSPVPLVQQGVEAYRTGEFDDAIALWQQALQAYPADAWADRAIVQENLARVHQQIGQTQTALDYWEAAAAAYRASDNSVQFGRMLIEQAQVYISLGQHQRAAALLCGDEAPAIAPMAETAELCGGGAYAIAAATDDRLGQVAALGSLAETYRLQGEYATAQTLLATGIAQVESQPALAPYEAPLLNSLGNTYARQFRQTSRRAEAAELIDREGIAARLTAAAQTYREQAVANLTQAIAIAQARADAPTEMRAQLSLLALQPDGGHARDLATIREQLGRLIDRLPASRETAYAAIAIAQSYRTAERNFACAGDQENPAVSSWLNTGLEIAKRIGDDRARSFALGELGHLAECQRDWDTAQRLTKAAQLAASNALESADSLYLWEWQAGRIYREQQLLDPAIAAYQQAIATLETIRTDILTADRELQFDFRDTVEPVYRQYIELQLTAAAEPPLTKQVFSPSPVNIAETLATVDALRLAELQNFFGDDCVLVASTDAREQLLADDPQTTILTSVVLDDRVVMIANLPDGTSQVHWVDEGQDLRQVADTFRSVLEVFTDRDFDLTAAEELYQQLIQPFEAAFERTQTQTLVFIQDGFLRNIPMSALYDGSQYLIEKYAIATTPALSLTAPRATTPQFQALAVGLSQTVVTTSGREFDDLRSVPDEIAAVTAALPGSQQLLDETFTVEQFRNALQAQRFPILHIATHGQFSTVPEETFVVTGPSPSGAAEELTFSQLEALLRESSPTAEPVELITLTACETATGDDRATLGLAGVAIQAGARSAIASLWRLDDTTAATLMPQFYRYLQNPDLNKAQALQAAQIEAIAANPQANPGRWAPLILVGNWQ